jgi:2-polyprenyl-3-methyl-5-hydroxy-6-metoxy-1,4-benzoquinol methylase
MTEVHRESGGHALVECAECGVWAVQPRPSLDELRARYDASYYAPWNAEAPARARMWRRRLRFLDRAWGKRLLDVGCAEGAFLDAARGAGFDVQGTELSPHGANTTAQRLGVPVHCGELIDARFESGSFDVMTLWHVLEHVLFPGETLAEAHRILRPDGLLVVAVPNRVCPIFRATYRIVRGRSLHLYHPGDREQHLYHWTPDSLTRALEQAGLEVVETAPDPCAVGRSKIAVDLVGRWHSAVARAPRTAAMVAVARRGAAS